MVSVGDLLQLTRKDLAGFPEVSVKYILELQKKGWKGTRSNRSHVAMMSPDGAHRFGLSQKEGGLAYLKRDVNKYYAARGEDPDMGDNVKAEKQKVIEKVQCPREDCNKTYASLEKLNVHIGVDHENKVVCEHTFCDELFNSKKVMRLHMARKHDYQSPRYKQRKAQEAARAKKKEEETAAALPAMVDYLQKDAEATTKIMEGGVEALNELNDEMRQRAVTVDVESVGRVYLEQEDIDESQMAYFVEREPQPGEEPHVNVILKETPAFEKDELLKQAETFGIENPDLLRSIQEHARIDDWEAKQRALRADANRLQEERDLLVEEIDFIDTRDSWTLDLKDILERRSTVEEVVTMMAAAGLGLEIRVWKI